MSFAQILTRLGGKPGGLDHVATKYCVTGRRGFKAKGGRGEGQEIFWPKAEDYQTDISRQRRDNPDSGEDPPRSQRLSRAGLRSGRWEVPFKSDQTFRLSAALRASRVLALAECQEKIA